MEGSPQTVIYAITPVRDSGRDGHPCGQIEDERSVLNMLVRAQLKTDASTSRGN